jgi:hypothetical protein
MNWTVISLRGLLAPASLLALGCLGAYLATTFGRVSPGFPIGPEDVMLYSFGATYGPGSRAPGGVGAAEGHWGFSERARPIEVAF